MDLCPSWGAVYDGTTSGAPEHICVQNGGRNSGAIGRSMEKCTLKGDRLQMWTIIVHGNCSQTELTDSQ